jgi:hypothetical protein
MAALNTAQDKGGRKWTGSVLSTAGVQVCSLDAEGLPKAGALKMWSPGGTMGGSGSFKRWGLVGGA